MWKVGFFLFFVPFWMFGQSNYTRPDHLKTLDSLIQLSPSWGLSKADYPISFDSSVARAVTQQLLLDLAIGNTKPQLAYTGFNFDLRKDAWVQTIDAAVQNRSIQKLANYLINRSPEVNQLVRVLQDSTQYDDVKRNLLRKSINEYRWLAAVRAYYPLVLINIPAAYLRVYEKDKEVLAMKVVVGRKKRPSRTLASVIQTVVINPYWHVPRKIAVEELLPEIQKNFRYFTASHLDLLDRDGNKVNAAAVNWKKLSKNYFPYRLRQQTGVKNTLGILKMQFQNPFKMYLHDTSDKKYFAALDRFSSHGCIRLEKPIQLAKFLLNDQVQAIDTLKITGPYTGIPPKYLRVRKQVPILIWYNLIDFDQTGKLVFLKLKPNAWRLKPTV